MISLKELNPLNLTPDEVISANLNELHTKMNLLRVAFGKPMIVTSGLRSIEHHKKIYLAKGISGNKIPMGSKHLYGQACDIYDPDGELKKFIKNNQELLVEIGLWCEDFNFTKNWVHFQIVPPKSGKRFFIP